MIDNLSILFSLSMIMWVVFRAVALNKIRPWYDRDDGSVSKSGAKPGAKTGAKSAAKPAAPRMPGQAIERR